MTQDTDMNFYNGTPEHDIAKMKKLVGLYYITLISDIESGIAGNNFVLTVFADCMGAGWCDGQPMG